MLSTLHRGPSLRYYSHSALPLIPRLHADPALHHLPFPLPLVSLRPISHLPRSSSQLAPSPLRFNPTPARQSHPLHRMITAQPRRPLSTTPPSSSSLPAAPSSPPPFTPPSSTATAHSTSASPLTLSASPVPSSSPSTLSSAWSYWTSEPAEHPRYSALWWRDAVLVLVVFSITGSLSLYIVRPLLSDVLGLQGSMRDGPWSYRILTLLLVPPAYSLMLLTIGTAAGRHTYFKRVALRMWGRILPKRWTAAKPQPSTLTKTREAPAKLQ